MAHENSARGYGSTAAKGQHVKPAWIVCLLFLGWLILQFFPTLGRGWFGLIGGCITVWLIYLLLRHTPDRPRGNDTEREWRDHGRD
jgi:membrane associated rhomboid family serine protease